MENFESNVKLEGRRENGTQIIYMCNKKLVIIILIWNDYERIIIVIITIPICRLVRFYRYILFLFSIIYTYYIYFIHCKYYIPYINVIETRVIGRESLIDIFQLTLCLCIFSFYHVIKITTAREKKASLCQFFVFVLLSLFFSLSFLQI